MNQPKDNRVTIYTDPQDPTKPLDVLIFTVRISDEELEYINKESQKEGITPWMAYKEAIKKFDA